MSRWGAVLALALVLTSHAALAQKAAKPRVVVLDFEGDKRGALRNQVETGLKKGKQVEVVPLKKYTAAASKAGLKGAAAQTADGIAQVAPGLGLTAVVTATAGRTLEIQVQGSDGRELWTKSVKLQRGKMSASEARRLVAGIAATAAKPPPAVTPPPTEPATPPTPSTPEPSPPVAVTPPPSASPSPPEPIAAKPPPSDAAPAETKPPATPPATSSADAPVDSTPEKPSLEPEETPKSVDDESHTSTKPVVAAAASQTRLDAEDKHRHPPFIHLFLGGTTTWRTYCARPGSKSCAEFDSRPEENQTGDTIDFKSGVPYLGLTGQIELLPLARSGNALRGLGLVAGYQQGYSETQVKVTTDSGETPTRSVVATDTVITGMLLYRYYFNMGTVERPRLAYAGFRGGLLSRAFEVDQKAQVALTGSHRMHPSAGLEFSVPLRHWLRVEGGGQFFIGPKAGKSLTADEGELELEVRDLGTEVSSAGWFGELGLAGEVWGPLGYSVRGRYTTVKDTFTGAGARVGWEQGGVASEQHIDIRWGLTASF
ncbi:hypothetical protein [Hyalangium versicolor]|uniref:hypothetical protein n=1 Tax=Hyalangium versicolor TaxID=2861190 RepID=UPI001CC9A382|nr:hypothetical protein [Hyalangium versicolor]